MTGIGMPPTETTMTSTEEDRPTTPPRHTRQRARIRQAVASIATFTTAQEIHDRLRHDDAKVGLATVYRTLQAMASAGEVDVLRTADGQVAYRICSPGHHHHLICRSCGRTVEILMPGLEQLIAGMAADHGFAEVGHELEFFGRCSACQ